MGEGLGGADLLGEQPGHFEFDVAFARGPRIREAAALPAGEVSSSGAQDVPEPIERVILVATVAADLLLDPATEVIDDSCGELDEVERAHRGGGSRSTVSRRRIPRRSRQGQLPRHDVHFLAAYAAGVQARVPTDCTSVIRMARNAAVTQPRQVIDSRMPKRRRVVPHLTREQASLAPADSVARRERAPQIRPGDASR